MASRSQTEQENQPVDLDELLKELANKIERLKVLYEQYFMGIEKMEPQVARKEVTRVMLGLQQQYIRNTALRFRFNTMLQKWNIYITYWNRVLREIELGTYVRHLQKAKRKAEQEGLALPEEMPFKKIRPPSGTFSLDEETHNDGPRRFLDAPTPMSNPRIPPGELELEEVFDRIAPDAKPGATPKPVAPPPLPPPAMSATDARAQSVATKLPSKGPPLPGMTKPAAPPPTPRAKVTTPLPQIPGMTEPELRALHQRYVDAQKQSGATATVKYETLVNSLAKQAPNVLSKPGVKGVKFDVTVENGKPILKAIPRK